MAACPTELNAGNESLDVKYMITALCLEHKKLFNLFRHTDINSAQLQNGQCVLQLYELILFRVVLMWFAINVLWRARAFHFAGTLSVLRLSNTLQTMLYTMSLVIVMFNSHVNQLDLLKKKSVLQKWAAHCICQTICIWM